MYPLLILTSLHAEFNDWVFFSFSVICLDSTLYVALTVMGWGFLVWFFFLFGGVLLFVCFLILKELSQYQERKDKPN